MYEDEAASSSTPAYFISFSSVAIFPRKSSFATFHTCGWLRTASHKWKVLKLRLLLVAEDPASLSYSDCVPAPTFPSMLQKSSLYAIHFKLSLSTANVSTAALLHLSTVEVISSGVTLRLPESPKPDVGRKPSSSSSQAFTDVWAAISSKRWEPHSRNQTHDEVGEPAEICETLNTSSRPDTLYELRLFSAAPSSHSLSCGTAPSRNFFPIKYRTHG